MTMLNLTAYAATHGVTKQSAAEWKAKGYLVTRDGLIDAEASDEQMRQFGKGRFRAKAHGGRRQKGVRGVIDRPALGHVGGRNAIPDDPPAEAATDPAEAYQADRDVAAKLRAAWEAGDEEEFAEYAALVAWWKYDNDQALVRWSRWPDAIAPKIAAELGIVGRDAALAAALRRHVLAHLCEVDGVTESDLAEIEASLAAAGADLPPGILVPAAD